jgi:addiction module HigA family antidote
MSQNQTFPVSPLSERTRKPSHPGGIIKRMHLDLGITITSLSESLGVARKTISKIVNERGSVTPEMALRLAKSFKTSPDLWLNLQKNYDLWGLLHDKNAEWKSAHPVKVEDQ